MPTSASTDTTSAADTRRALTGRRSVREDDLTFARSQLQAEQFAGSPDLEEHQIQCGFRDCGASQSSHQPINSSFTQRWLYAWISCSRPAPHAVAHHAAVSWRPRRGGVDRASDSGAIVDALQAGLPLHASCCLYHKQHCGPGLKGRYRGKGSQARRPRECRVGRPFSHPVAASVGSLLGGSISVDHSAGGLWITYLLADRLECVASTHACLGWGTIVRTSRMSFNAQPGRIRATT